MTHKASADKKHRDGYVLKILRAERLARVTKVLEEDVGGTVGKDDGALDELGTGPPLATIRRLWSDVPRLRIVQTVSLKKLRPTGAPRKSDAFKG